MYVKVYENSHNSMTSNTTAVIFTADNQTLVRLNHFFGIIHLAIKSLHLLVLVREIHFTDKKSLRIIVNDILDGRLTARWK